MGAYTKSIMTKLGQVRKKGGGPAPTVRLKVDASQTIYKGDILVLDGTTQLLKQAVATTGLDTDGYGITADVTGRKFVATHDFVSTASATNAAPEYADVVELTQDVEVYLCVGQFPTSAGAVTATGATSGAVKVNIVYGIGRFRGPGGVYFYGMDLNAPGTASAGLTLVEWSQEKSSTESYPFGWFTQASAYGL